MNDDLALMLHERLATAAEEIHPANDLLVDVRRRYTRRRAGSRVALLASATAVVAAAVAAPGLVNGPAAGSQQRQIAAAGSTASTPSRPATIALYGHEFTLPTGFSVTLKPTETTTEPIKGSPKVQVVNPRNRNWAVASRDAAEVVMSTSDDSTSLFGKIPSDHITIAGQDATIGVVDRLLAPQTCQPTVCGLTPVPHFTIEILIAPGLYLQVSTSGITKAQAVAIVASGFN